MTKSSRRIVAACAVLAMIAVPAAANADSATASGLGTDLDTLLANSELTGANVGLVVLDADTGATVYSKLGDNLLLPASNEKLVTSAAAMSVLGPAYTFTTSVSRTGTVSGSTLTGNLYLKGTGDPTMLYSDYQALAAKVAAAGITTVSGDLVADDTYFDSVRLGPAWSWDDEPYSYDAQISALTVAPTTSYDSGSVYVTVKPGTQGQAPTVTLTPPNSYVTIANTATTGASGTGSSISINRPHGSNTITVSGSIPVGGAAAGAELAVDNPTAYVASLFRQALAADGVQVTGGTTYAATPYTATQLTSHSSMPLTQMLVPFLKLSNNMMAEALTKAAGRKVSNKGTFAAGVSALETAFSSFGIDYHAVKQVDGSGLSRMDLVTPDQLAQLLVKARSQSWFQTWYDALPIAGNPDPLVGGTLASRMVGTAAANNVHAKTGSETGVSALSGYVTAADGEHLVFALEENDFLPSSVKNVEDAVAVRLANYDGTADTAHQRLRLPTEKATPFPVNDPRTALECSWTHTC
jgi:D-alanyl-D-alanine carboxypeptidase/D-alanyl-D-alanine-endopeptidase (penicillin-binding protein 4)